MHGVSFNVYLFDEILDALDPENVMITLRMLQKFSEENCVVLISHTHRDYVECDEHLAM